ncbi:hypothetical protein [Borreliella garinii]|uniref:hypothetical protein n=1 Tax=Borreliella garinii TaxID=29519 RepID=UPI000A84D6F6|nr:hypothetical protein [Borreliella garinii]
MKLLWLKLMIMIVALPCLTDDSATNFKKLKHINIVRYIYNKNTKSYNTINTIEADETKKEKT